MQCPNCSKEIRNNAKVCGYCGHKLQTGTTKCPDCGEDRREGAKICGYCGHKFADAVQVENEEVTSASKPDPEFAPASKTESPSEPESKEESVVESIEDEPEPTPKTTEAIPGAVPEAKKSKPSKGKFAWMWIAVVLVIAAGAFALIQTQGWLLSKESFTGAIGNWKARDGGDGSYQTLTIRRTIFGTYKLRFVDENATACNGDPATATFTGSTSTAILSTKMEYYCEMEPEKPHGSVDVRLIYNAAQGKITDSWGDVWTRK